MEERTLQDSLRTEPPADPVYHPRLTNEPGWLLDRTHGSTTRSIRRTGPALNLARAIAAVAIVSLIAAMLLFATGEGPNPAPAASPSPTTPRDARLLVWANAWAWVVTPDGSVETSGEAYLMREEDVTAACPVLIGDTTMFALDSRSGIWFKSLDGSPVPSIDYIHKPRSSFATWSPDSRRLAVADQAGAVEVTSFEGPARPIEQRFHTPGIVGATWAPDGRRIAVARRVDDGNTVDVEIIDSVTGDARALGVEIDTDAAYVPMSWAPVGDRLLMAMPVIEDGSTLDGWDLVLVDVPSGGASVLARGFPGSFWSGWGETTSKARTEFAWTPDGSRVAISVSPFGGALTILDVEDGTRVDVPLEGLPGGGPAWTSDGSRLGFVDQGELVTISPDGSERSAQALRYLNDHTGSPSWTTIGVTAAPDGGFLVVHGAPAETSGPATFDPETLVEPHSLTVDRFAGFGEDPPTSLVQLDHPGFPAGLSITGTCFDGEW
jgi:hypothetical protein